MTWFKGRRGFLLAPVMAVMCGDSLAPGACGGKSGTAVEKGTFACTMHMGGTSVPCAGNWTYSKDDHEYVVTLVGGESAAAIPRARVWARISGDTAPVDVVVDEKMAISATARTSAGEYAAGAGGTGATGRAHLSALRPPAGTFSVVLVPLVTVAGDVGAPAGTTVSIEASF
jgi:hypothetical protein